MKSFLFVFKAWFNDIAFLEKDLFNKIIFVSYVRYVLVDADSQPWIETVVCIKLHTVIIANALQWANVSMLAIQY